MYRLHVPEGSSVGICSLPSADTGVDLSMAEILAISTDERDSNLQIAIFPRGVESVRQRQAPLQVGATAMNRTPTIEIRTR